MHASDISVVIPTRGDIDMRPVLNSLCDFGEVIVWDNSKYDEDWKCYGRFAAIEQAKHDVIYTQDDDVLIPISAMLRHYDPAVPGVFANKPAAEEWRFLGLGAFFRRDTVDCFSDYTERFGFNDEFFRSADVVYAYQHPYTSVDLGYGELEWSRYSNRMYLQNDHMLIRDRARSQTLSLLDEKQRVRVAA